MMTTLKSSFSDGHVFGTTRKSRWMRGAIVHVERQYNVLSPTLTSISIPNLLQT